MSSLYAINRLTEERKMWRKDHPYGFVAKPVKNPDGTFNMLTWECSFPGKDGTSWEGSDYHLVVAFSNAYPTNPPIVKFVPPVFHPNVYPGGMVCLSLLNIEGDWRACLTIKEILIGVRDLLDQPNVQSPANGPANSLYISNPVSYEEAIKKQAKAMSLCE